MNVTKLPGYGGELQDFYSSLPGVDEGHAPGAALATLSSLGGNELAMPSITRRSWVSFATIGGDGQQLVNHVEDFLNDVEGPPVPVQGWPGWESRVKSKRGSLRAWRMSGPLFILGPMYDVLIPANGQVCTAETKPSTPSELITRACALNAQRQPYNMNAHAEDLMLHFTVQWGRELLKEKRNAEAFDGRMNRWLNVAQRIATGTEHIITADVLMVARRIAVIDHEAAWEVLEQFGTEKPDVPVH